MDLFELTSDTPVTPRTHRESGPETLSPQGEPYHVHSGADQPKIKQNQIIQNLIELTNLSAHFPVGYDPGTGEITLQIGSSNQLLGVNNAGTASEYKTLSGTGNQIIVTPVGSALVLSTPQDLDPTSLFTMGGLTNNGGLKVKRRVVSGTTTVTATDFLLDVNTAAARAITLPAASAGRQFIIIKDGTGGAASFNITITPAGADTIDGAASLVISANNGVARLLSNGVSRWLLI